MTLRELINDLTDLEEKHGDVRVFIRDYYGGQTNSLDLGGFLVDRKWINQCSGGDIVDYEGESAVIISVG